jgi:hypothetical protein
MSKIVLQKHYKIQPSIIDDQISQRQQDNPTVLLTTAETLS